MGYHSKDDVQENYEISIEKACEVCDRHTIIDDEEQLQDQIRSLEKQRNVQSANYNLCDTDKKALSISFVNYKANSQLELNKLQSRYETLNSTMLGLRNLFNDVNKKAQDCENDKNGFTNEVLRLKDQLQQSDANSAECLNALELKSSDNTKLLAEKNKLENENQTRERLLQDKNTECEKAQQKLSENNISLIKTRLGFAEKMFLDALKRVESFVLDKPEERYQKLIIQKPEIIKRVADKHIASFIGVTPVSLSRIRKRLASQKK
jgi:chromosome segregation ATPase